LIYRFDHTPELQDVTLAVWASGGRLHHRVSGPASLGTRASLVSYFAWFNMLRPVRVSGGSHIYSLYIPPIPSAAHNHQLENHLRARTLERRTPMAATLAITDACQLDCVHCSAALRPKGRPPLDTDTWKRVIRECVDLGTSVVTFTGGEPLLRRDLDELIAAVPKDRAVAEFFCNGLQATPERMAEIKEAGAYGIHLSLDDPDETEHDRGRGREGVFKAVSQAARAARAAGLLVGLSTYATNESVDAHKLTRVAELGEDWGVSEISVFDGIRTGRMLRGCGPLLDAEHRRRLMAEARVANRVHKGRLRIVTQSWTNSGRGFSMLIGCLAANLQLHVTSQGDLTPCDFTPLSFGNVQDAPVADLWRHMLAHPAYEKRSRQCRMQSPEFRARYIDTIPEGASLPHPIDGERAPVAAF
jgi:MoaA/NifB/PqqE/SkfB family radical SAM enzyme